jgi:hypothetical protein
MLIKLTSVHEAASLNTKHQSTSIYYIYDTERHSLPMCAAYSVLIGLDWAHESARVRVPWLPDKSLPLWGICCEGRDPSLQKGLLAACVHPSASCKIQWIANIL